MVMLNVLNVIDEIVRHKTRYARRREVLQQERTLGTHRNLVVGISNTCHRIPQLDGAGKSQQIRKVARLCGGDLLRGRNRERDARVRRQERSLVTQEQERVILLNRTSERSAKLLTLRRRFHACREVIPRVEL